MKQWQKMRNGPVKTISFTNHFFSYNFCLGIGEHGKPANLTAADLPNYEKLYKVNGFNAALSDKIAVDRAIPDIRHKGWVICCYFCRQKDFNIIFLLGVEQKNI